MEILHVLYELYQRNLILINEEPKSPQIPWNTCDSLHVPEMTITIFLLPTVLSESCQLPIRRENLFLPWNQTGLRDSFDKRDAARLTLHDFLRLIHKRWFDFRLSFSLGNAYPGDPATMWWGSPNQLWRRVKVFQMRASVEVLKSTVSL